MNRAMALSPTKDVVWLNADTRVHGTWLDRLRQVAYSEARIASVTPFTNNGELMSFPQSQISHAMPSAKAQAELDELARQINSPPMEIETGCGFCMYIKRAALDEVGYLDEVRLARGYGEETDWCLRARALDWRHMGAPNVFVAHQGGISFGAEKSMRVAHNNAILRKRYPDASVRYKSFILRDPIKPARDALQRARLAQLASLPSTSQQAYWPASADTESGQSSLPSAQPTTLTPDSNTLHVHSGSHCETSFNLAWSHDPHRTRVTLQAPLEPLPLRLDFEIPREFGQLIDTLRLLPINNVVYEHLDRCPVELCDLPRQLDKPYHIICRDNRLLSEAGDRDWQRFAYQAASVQLPWQALKDAHVNSYPKANWLSPGVNKHPRMTTDAPRILIIGDMLDSPTIASRWMALARQMIRQQIPVVLLATADTPSLKHLKSTGAVYRLPELPGFSVAERAHAAGCSGVLSLDDTPCASWQAPLLAIDLNVPLFAGPNPIAEEAGAHPLSSLPFPLSQA